MLRVFVVLQGSHQPLEITLPPSGQNLVAASPPPGAGRKAHFWWGLEDLEQKDPEAARALRMLAPNLDRLYVGREMIPGQALHTVFDGTVVECGFDPTMVSLTAMEPHRQAAPPQAPPSGGVREPVRPAPSGPGPEGASAPGPFPGPQPVARPTAPPPNVEERLDLFAGPRQQPGPTTSTGGAGNILTQGMYVRGRDSDPAAQAG